MTPSSRQRRSTPFQLSDHCIVQWPLASTARVPQQLAGLLVQFEILSEAWPKPEHILDRAGIGRQRAETLLAIRDLRMRIANVRAKTLEDAAVQLRRLDAMIGDDDREQALLAASVLAVVERVRA